MPAIFGNMMHGVIGFSAAGVFSPHPENPAAQGPLHGTFIYDEFASGVGMGGGASRVSEDQYVTPTRAQEIRFGLRRVLRGVSGAYEDFVGLNDPPDEAFFRRPRAATKAASRVEPDRPRIVEDLIEEFKQALADAEARAETYRQRAEEYAPAALQVAQLKRQLRRLEDLQRKSSRENETLRQVCTEADAALEKAKTALEDANARAEENAELACQAIGLNEQVQDLQSKVDAAQAEAHEFREAIGLFSKAAGMEQKLRVRAERQAQECLQVMDSVEAGFAQLSQSILSLRKKFKAATLQGESAKRHRDERMTKELEDLKAQLAAKQAEVDKLNSQLREAEALKADRDRLRGELASSKASERAARAEATRHRQAAEAARARVQDSEPLLKEIDELRRLLKGTRDAEASAKDDALRQRQATERAEAELERQRKAAAREKARADQNEGLAKEASQLRQRVRELEQVFQEDAARRRGWSKIIDRIPRGVSIPQSRRVVSLDPDVAEAFKTLELETTASCEEFDSRRVELTFAYHPDRYVGAPSHTRAWAEAKMTAVNLAVDKLENHFRPQGSAVSDRDCA